MTLHVNEISQHEHDNALVSLGARNRTGIEPSHGKTCTKACLCPSSLVGYSALSAAWNQSISFRKKSVFSFSNSIYNNFVSEAKKLSKLSAKPRGLLLT